MTKPKIIASETSFDWIGLRRFAGYFHQDFGIMCPDPVEGITAYIDALARKEAALLHTELEKFLKDNESKRALKNAWVKLGGQYWLDRPQLENALSMLAEKSK